MEHKYTLTVTGVVNRHSVISFTHPDDLKKSKLLSHIFNRQFKKLAVYKALDQFKLVAIYERMARTSGNNLKLVEYPKAIGILNDSVTELEEWI